MGRKSSFSLDDSEILTLEELRLEAQACGDFPTDRRARALLLVGRDGTTRREAAEICEFTERTVYKCQLYFRNAGVDGLRTIPSPGRPSRLSADEKVSLAELVENGPEAAGLDTGIWTCSIIAELVKRRFDVSLSISQIGRILHQLRFSVQYPRTKLAKADPEKQEHWWNEVYPVIQEQAKAEDATIFLKMRAASNRLEADAKPGPRWERVSS